MDKSISAFSQELLRIFPRIVKGMIKKQKNALVWGKITVPQCITLEMLKAKKFLKMKDIARQLNVTLPAATGLIDRLHRMAMIKRANDDKDRRIILITLTTKGKDTVEKIQQQRKKALMQVFSKLTEKERDTYLNILKKLEKILYPKDDDK